MDLLLFNIKNITSELDTLTENVLTSLGIWGAIISCFIITAESILPFLPLCVFITIEFYMFGGVTGFVISWIFTCLGCLLAFRLTRSKLKSWIYRHLIKKDGAKLKRIIKYVEDVPMSGLAVLVAIPFTPAFLVNIACGLSDMSEKKFMLAMGIGKSVMVYFWGYIGITLVECLTHPEYLFKVVGLLLGTFIISKILGYILEYE